MPFSIKEASERLGCPAHTIRYYEREGLLPFIQRDEHGNRLFEEEHLDWIRMMTCFRVTGMKISDLRKIVELALQGGNSTIQQRKMILEAHKEELLRKQEELNLAFAAIEKKLSLYDEIASGTVRAEREFSMKEGE